METVLRSLEDLRDEVEQGYKNSLESGLPAPPPGDLYLSNRELLDRLKEFRTIIFGDLELVENSGTSFRLESSSNSDIRSTIVKSAGFDAAMSSLVKKFSSWRDSGCEVNIISHTEGQAMRLLKLLEPYSLGLYYGGRGFVVSDGNEGVAPSISLYIGELSLGFRAERAGIVFVTEEEIFGARVRASSKKRARGLFISSLDDLSEGELVVHEDYGIGIFRGLVKKEFDEITSEVMVIEYAGGDLLYHPVERLQSIQKYVSGSDLSPRIDRLGGKGWEKTKARIKKSIKEMAKDLLEIYAKRQTATRPPYSRIDDDFAAFEASFEFEETPDQAKAIQDVMESLDSDRPMDRLVCGDVGYGKTEVAIRAAFRVVMDGKQVAVLVPTTVLAQQHYETFCKRFSGYPIVIEALSRFRNPAEQKEIVEKLAIGKIDLVVGTHRLLQKDVRFKDLGLLVLDEEQRFGVAHKERIKKFRAHVDVLTLTATPIPRTLNLSLSGIRDLSIIETPPTNRRSIRTYVMRQSDEVVKDAISRELGRGGQVFYLHNRVQTIYQRAASLQRLVPEARIGVAHGQMADGELEQVMLNFISGNLNTLVCTSIIESGLDIPRANTIIIERADTFGLADLYQLKGRVGRSHVRAYSYLLTPPETLMTTDAVKRLAVIQEHTELGQGFRVAMRDMEIRGAGNILGTSQSGHVGQVGYEMYLDLLEEAVREMKGEPQEEKIDPEIHLKVEALIPDDYVPDPKQRMNLYKKLSKASNHNEIDETEDEIIDLYGKEPAEVVSLITLMRIRLEMKELGILKLDYTNREIIFSFVPVTKINPTQLIEFVQSEKRMRLIPGDRVGYKLTDEEIDHRIDICFNVLKKLKSLMDQNIFSNDENSKKF
ncbi:MAG: transcription-repair coupling factor, partial [Desulfomonilaceae bacterium]